MIYARLFNTVAEHEGESGHPEVTPMVCYAQEDDVVFYHSHIEEPVTIPRLIEEGYAFRDSDADNFVQIMPTCPYLMEDIIDFDDYQYIWKENLPSTWDDAAIIERYNDSTMPTKPNAAMFWGIDFTGCENFNITYNCNIDWAAVDYPWGKYHSDGIFSHRYDPSQPFYSHATPKNVSITFNGYYTSVMQTAFANMSTTETISLVCNNGWGTSLSAHDWTGGFENDGQLKTIYFRDVRMHNGNAAFSLVHNLCKDCHSLTVFPLGTPSQGRDADYNSIMPGCRDQTSGNASVSRMFQNCSSMTAIMPTLDFRYVTSFGDPESTAEYNNALCFAGCTSLEDMRLKNLNCNWDFTSCPKLSVTSIEYILNNVMDKGTGANISLVLPILHQTEISSDAITNATDKGWIVTFA